MLLASPISWGTRPPHHVEVAPLGGKNICVFKAPQPASTTATTKTLKTTSATKSVNLQRSRCHNRIVVPLAFCLDSSTCEGHVVYLGQTRNKMPKEASRPIQNSTRTEQQMKRHMPEFGLAVLFPGFVFECN